MHDHLSHGNTMTVVVKGNISRREPHREKTDIIPGTQDASGIAQELLGFCSLQKSKDSCFNGQFSALSQKNDFGYVLEIFRKLVEISKDATGCHQIAHEISRTFIGKEPDKWKQFLANAPPDCNYGFTHGAIEGYVRLYNTEINITPGFIRDVCSESFDKSEKQAGQCVHVFGHMLLVSEKADVPKSLSICLTMEGFHSDQCFHGVFMENLVKFNLAAEGLTNVSINIPIKQRFSLKDVQELCSPKHSLPTDLCWREMSHAYLFISNYNPSITFRSCEDFAPTASAAASCIMHGLDSIIAQNEENPLLSKPACFVKTNISGFMKRCYMTVAKHAANSDAENRKKAADLCNGAPANIRPSCLLAITLK